MLGSDFCLGRRSYEVPKYAIHEEDFRPGQEQRLKAQAHPLHHGDGRTHGKHMVALQQRSR